MSHEPLREIDGKPIKGLKRCKHCDLSETYWKRWPECKPHIKAGDEVYHRNLGKFGRVAAVRGESTIVDFIDGERLEVTTALLSVREALTPPPKGEREG